MLPVIFLVNLRTHGFVQVPQARGRQRSLINVLAMFIMTYTLRSATAKLKSANVFISAAWDQTTKFNDRQYFQLYGMWHYFHKLRTNSVFTQSGKTSSVCVRVRQQPSVSYQHMTDLVFKELIKTQFPAGSCPVTTKNLTITDE